MGSTIYGTIDPLAQNLGQTGSIKTNHIMVYFTDYYNAISIDRLPLKTKIRKDS